MRFSKGDFIQSKEIKSNDDNYNLRIRQMQPAMVQFVTNDALEREFINEVRNLSDDKNVFFAGMGSSKIYRPPTPRVTTMDALEKELMQEVDDLSVDDETYFVSEMEMDIEMDKVTASPSSINAAKMTLEQAAAKAKADAQPKTNKPLLYGLVAGIAALFYFKD